MNMNLHGAVQRAYTDPAPAKSGVGFGDSCMSKARKRPRFRVGAIFTPDGLPMAMRVGRPSGLPVSFDAGSPTPHASSPSFWRGMVMTDSIQSKEAINMATHLQTVDFHGQSLVVLNHNEQPYVAMRSVCEGIGLHWEGQLQRIKRHSVLGPSMCVIHMEGEHGKKRDYVCLPLSMLNGWLFGVDANRVKPEIRDRLIDYQRECFQVLYQHWHQPAPIISNSVQQAINDRADRVTRPFFELIRKELREQAEQTNLTDPAAIEFLPLPEYALVARGNVQAAATLAQMQQQWFRELKQKQEEIQKLFARGTDQFGDAAFCAVALKTQADRNR